MAKTNIWMPLYWADYMNDTSMLSLAEHGAYMMLLKEYWQQGGALENDRERIYRACKAINEDDQRNIDYILDKFFQEKSGKFYNKRADLELKKAKKNKRQRSEAGRLSGVARRTNVQREHERTPEQNTNPTPTPSLFELSKDNSSLPREGAAVKFELPEWLPEEDWQGFVEMRKKIKAPLTPQAIALTIRDLTKIKNAGLNPVEAIQKSTQNAWRGVFSPREELHGKRTNGRATNGGNAGNARTTSAHEGFSSQGYEVTGKWSEVIGGNDS